MNFSKQTRQEIYTNSKGKTFDIIIIGGGIIGAGIALEAATRGLSILLVEAQDFAEGAAFCSTKLGGRSPSHLKNMKLNQFGEAGREHSILYQNAPHIVYPQKMTLPIYKGMFWRKWISIIALWLYDLLSRLEKKYRMQTLTVKETLENVPSLTKKGLKGGIQYYEYRTKAARLTIENLKKSLEFGAQCINYSELIEIEQNKEGKTKITVKDKLTNNEIELSSKLLINATGVWSDKLLKDHLGDDKNQVFPSKRVHIMVDRKKVDCKTAVYFALENDRMLFVIPQQDKLVISTSEQAYSGDDKKGQTKKDEILYLLKSFNRWFSIELTLADVEMDWAEIRSFILSKTKSSGQVFRKEGIFFHNQHFISVFGGESTAYRLMAEKVVDKAILLLNKSFEKSTSHKTPLAGADFEFGKVEPHKIIDYAETKFNEAYPIGSDAKAINTLFYNYGKNVEIIIEKAYDIYNLTKDKKTSLLEAEIWYSVNYEMTISLSDFMIRRTGRAYMNKNESQKQIDIIAKYLGQYLEWSESDTEQQISQYKGKIKLF